MKERPILFNGPMVRAILEGRKTQTRRIIKPQPQLIESSGRWFWEKALDVNEYPLVDASRHWWEYYGTSQLGKPGDRLWVRETFSGPRSVDNLPLSEWNPRAWNCPIWYWADGDPEYGDWTRNRPSIHMPRWASRITLEITGVRVERLQDISEADLKAEGVREGTGDFAGCFSCGAALSGTTARECYSRFWAGSWDNNPWVWVIDFRAIKQ
jgi:hypothetical protein